MNEEQNIEFVREKKWWEHYPLHQLWCNDQIPLVPRFEYRKGDELNTNNIYIHWLIFSIWTFDYFIFALDLKISFFDISLNITVPYLTIRIGFINFYNDYLIRINGLLRRKSPYEKKNG